MLGIRFLVLDKNNVVLGGNQRFKACESAGLKEIPVVRAEDLSEQDLKKFVIADNSYYGEFDQQMVKVQYSLEELDDVGLKVEDILSPTLETVAEAECCQPTLDKKKDIYDGNEIKQIVTYFPFDLYEKLMDSFDAIKEKMGCEENADMLLRLIAYWKENYEG